MQCVGPAIRRVQPALGLNLHNGLQTAQDYKGRRQSPHRVNQLIKGLVLGAREGPRLAKLELNSRSASQ